jgi:hypothetical protein
LRVTFDTHTLDRITSPLRAECKAIQEALQSQRIQGYFCETVLTVEGGERALVLGREPPKAETLARVQRALGVGMRILSAPREGSPCVDDPHGKFYANDVDLPKRLERHGAIVAAIEARGAGFGRVLKVARSLSRGAALESPIASIDLARPPASARKVAPVTFDHGRSAANAPEVAQAFDRVRGPANAQEVARAFNRVRGPANAREVARATFDRTRSPTDARKVARAFAEWADGDSVAAHYGYANDLFCTEDRAVRAGRHSVMHPAQRSWLRRVYGVEFVNIAELAARVSAARG